jgi:plasmid stability protein
MLSLGMAQVLIRNLDDELVAAYRAAAKRDGRSLEAQLREALWVMQPLTPERVAQLVAEADRIRAMTPNVPQTPSEDLIRADRDGFRDI